MNFEFMASDTPIGLRCGGILTIFGRLYAVVILDRIRLKKLCADSDW